MLPLASTSEPSLTGTSQAAGGWKRPAAARQALLRLPTFYKVLIANSAIVVLGATAGTMMTAERVRADPHGAAAALVLAFAGIGTLLSILCNAAVLRAALAPIHQLERTINAVRGGDLGARVQHLAISDEDIARVGETLNALLDELAVSRRRLRDLSAQVLSAQEDERRRISRELHDDTAQSLTSLALVLKAVEDTESHPALRAQLREVRHEVERGIEGVRRLARDLRPSTLDDLGLAAAVDWYVQAFRKRTGMTVEYDSELGDARLSEAVELALYRIVQEALTNVVKHAHASVVRVALSRTQEVVTVRIADDGVGVAVRADENAQTAGVGLYGMRERAELIGGHLSLHSVPGRGVTIEVTAPLYGG